MAKVKGKTKQGKMQRPTFTESKDLLFTQEWHEDSPFPSERARKKAWESYWQHYAPKSPGVRPAAWYAYTNTGGERHLICHARFVFNGQECYEPEHETEACFLVRTGQAEDDDVEMFLKMHASRFSNKNLLFLLDRFNFMKDVYEHERQVLETLAQDPKWQAKVKPLLDPAWACD